MKRSLTLGTLAGLFALAPISTLYGQCPCQGGTPVGGIVYGESDAGIPYSPEMELEQVDVAEETIHFTVVVDGEAIVKVNGEPTITKGTIRPYVVRGLKAGKVYEFDFQAIVRKPKGDVYVAKEKVTIKAGESKQVVLKVKRANRAEYPPPEPPVAPAPAAPAPAA